MCPMETFIFIRKLVNTHSIHLFSFSVSLIRDPESQSSTLRTCLVGVMLPDSQPKQREPSQTHWLLLFLRIGIPHNQISIAVENMEQPWVGSPQGSNNLVTKTPLELRAIWYNPRFNPSRRPLPSQFSHSHSPALTPSAASSEAPPCRHEAPHRWPRPHRCQTHVHLLRYQSTLPHAAQTL